MAVALCVLHLYEKHPPDKWKTYPVADRIVRRSFACAASTKEVRLNPFSHCVGFCGRFWSLVRNVNGLVEKVLSQMGL